MEKTEKRKSFWKKCRRRLKKLVQFLLNPRLLICMAIAWMITNGWSYVLFTLGTLLEIEWMMAVGAAYLAFLWLPISPEKIVTFSVAIGLLRLLFPNDQKTLAVLRGWYNGAKRVFRDRRNKGSQD